MKYSFKEKRTLAFFLKASVYPFYKGCVISTGILAKVFDLYKALTWGAKWTIFHANQSVMVKT